MQQRSETQVIGVPLAVAEEAAGVVRARLEGQRFATLAAVAVCRDGTLLRLF